MEIKYGTKRLIQSIDRILQAIGKAIAAQCLFLIGIILHFGPVIIGIVLSLYIGGYTGATLTAEITSIKWVSLIGGLAGASLLWAFLSGYIFWPHMWPAIVKVTDVLTKSISELQK